MNTYDQVEWLRSNKGGAKIIHKGYMYTIHKKRYGRIRWRCAQRTLHCKGSITTGSGAPIINLPHNHVPDLQAVVQARSRTSQITDENIECTADIFPMLSDNIYSYPEDCNETAEQNIDYELNERPINEIIQSQNNISQSIPSNTMNTSNTSSPPESEMCLRWNSHHTNIQNVFPSLLQNEKYVDATLASDGQYIRCHKLILSTCSEYFDEIFKDTYPMQHTVLYLRGIPFWVIKALVDFMYKGEVNIDQMKLEPLLKAAEELQIKGLAGKAKVKKEPEHVPQTIIEPKPPKEVFEKKKTPEPKPPQVKEVVEKPIKREEIERDYDEGMDDDKDDDFTPNQYYKRKLQIQTKKMRKRKVTAPPDPSVLKQVKINLKGTKSRPNIKQPKYFDPDYPEYDPDRSSPSKLDSSDPIFNIDNIKMEPIDFEVPTSPTYSEISSLMDQSITECATLEKLKTEKSKPVEAKPTEEPKKIRKYAGKTPKQPNFTQDKQAIFETACSSIDIPPTILNKDDTELKEEIDIVTLDDPLQNQIQINLQNKIVDSTSYKKLIDSKKLQNTSSGSSSSSSEVDKPTFTPIRVRKLPTTEHVLKKFATTQQLTSILKKETVPAILRRVSSPKPAILRHSTPKKIEIVKADSSEIAEKLSALAKTKKELTSTETSSTLTSIVKKPEVEAPTKPTETLTNTKPNEK